MDFKSLLRMSNILPLLLLMLFAVTVRCQERQKPPPLPAELGMLQNDTPHLNIVMSYKPSNLSDHLSNKFLLDLFQQQLRNSPHMNFAENPLVCDCKLLDRLKLLNNSRDKFYERQKLSQRCTQPPNLVGVALRDLLPEQLLCPLPNPADCPPHCECWQRPADEKLLINCTHARLTRIPRLPYVWPYYKIVLHLEHNLIESLPPFTAQGAGYITTAQLYLSHNRLTQLDDERLPRVLTHLDIASNQLTALTDNTLQFLNASTTLQHLKLADNPWHCDCANQQLLLFALHNSHRIDDLNEMHCANGKLLLMISANDICAFNTLNIVLVFTTLAACGAIIFLVYQIFRTRILQCLHRQMCCRRLISEDTLDNDRYYDAFVSYSHKDKAFISEQLLPPLEMGPLRYRVCDHTRDWMVGEYIPTQIKLSVAQSRRTIVVLSAGYLRSTWGRMEFNTAHEAARLEQRARIIVIVYGSLDTLERARMPEAMRGYLERGQYLQWGDVNFWSKLTDALPTPKPPSDRPPLNHPLRRYHLV